MFDFLRFFRNKRMKTKKQTKYSRMNFNKKAREFVWLLRDKELNRETPENQRSERRKEKRGRRLVPSERTATWPRSSNALPQWVSELGLLALLVWSVGLIARFDVWFDSRTENRRPVMRPVSLRAEDSKTGRLCRDRSYPPNFFRIE